MRCVPHRVDSGHQLSGCWQGTPPRHAFRLPFWSGTHLASSVDTKLNVTVSIPRATRALAKWTVKPQIWRPLRVRGSGKTSEIASCRRLGNRGQMRKLRHIDADSPNHVRSKMRHPSFVTRNPFESSAIKIRRRILTKPCEGSRFKNLRQCRAETQHVYMALLFYVAPRAIPTITTRNFPILSSGIAIRATTGGSPVNRSDCLKPASFSPD